MPAPDDQSRGTGRTGSARIFVRYSSPRYRYKERNIPVSSQSGQRLIKNTSNAMRLKIKSFLGLNGAWNTSSKMWAMAAGLDKHLSFDMCRWTSALNDLTAGIDTDKIRQKLGISKIQWREVYAKLHSLAKELGYELSSTSAAEALD